MTHHRVMSRYEYYDDAGEDDEYLVDDENEIVEPDVDVHLFGISNDVLFDNIDVTNLVPDDILEGEDIGGCRWF
ncbi:hypothetical protein Tco_1148956 [Tanacetum coccineum]